MNQHLSPQQIDEWVLNPFDTQRPAEVEEHLRSCPACAGEAARVAEPLTLFSGAVRSWGEEQMGPVRGWARVEKRNPGWWRAGLAVATLWLLVAVPVYRHRQQTREAALTAAQDEILLQQVERELSQSVPSPMEPLAKLMPNDLSR